MLRVHHPDSSREATSRSLFVSGTDHFVGEVDADDVARRADPFHGRKQYRSATARDVKQTLPGFNVSEGHKAPAEMREASRSCVILGRDLVEHCLDLAFGARQVIVHLHPPTVIDRCDCCPTSLACG